MPHLKSWTRFAASAIVELTIKEKNMTVSEICRINDLSVRSAEKALAAMQDKGLISGFVPGDLNAEIKTTAKADVYKD
jgi:DNA-binding IscR family transcriptional regulator